ncbi:MAG: class I SAM-dependent methyltransferase [Polyangiaceae bacterium]
MLLNRTETLLMNNPVRAALQRQVEARMFESLGGTVRGKACLEVGCGRGEGVEIIFERFGAARVDAFDLDPKMVALARQRLAGRGRSVRLWQGSVTAIDAPSGGYAAVFDFGIVHHVPDWRRALSEMYRVLEPGGRLYAEEVLAGFLASPLWSRVLDHPKEDRFDAITFAEALTATGFELRQVRTLWNRFAWFVADRPVS